MCCDDEIYAQKVKPVEPKVESKIEIKEFRKFRTPGELREALKVEHERTITNIASTIDVRNEALKKYFEKIRLLREYREYNERSFGEKEFKAFYNLHSIIVDKKKELINSAELERQVFTPSQSSMNTEIREWQKENGKDLINLYYKYKMANEEIEEIKENWAKGRVRKGENLEEMKQKKHKLEKEIYKAVCPIFSTLEEVLRLVVEFHGNKFYGNKSRSMDPFISAKFIESIVFNQELDGVATFQALKILQTALEKFKEYNLNRLKDIFKKTNNFDFIDDFIDSKVSSLLFGDDAYMAEMIAKHNVKMLQNENAVMRMESATQSLVKSHSDDRATFMHAGFCNKASNAKIHLQIGGFETKISQGEMDRFLSGKKPVPTLDKFFNELKNGNVKTDIIVYRDVFAQSIGRSDLNGRFLNSRHHVDPLKLTVALKKRYSNKANFYLDDEMDMGKANLASLPIVKRANNLAVYINGFAVTDFDVIKNIEVNLRKVGIQIVPDNDWVPKSNILVITGHKDVAFKNYIETLGQKGTLQDKVVALFSCYQSGDESLNSRMIRDKFKAKAVLFFSETINPIAVEEVLKRLEAVLNNVQQQPRKLNDILEQCVNEALKATSHPKLKGEIEKMRNGVLQLSYINDLTNKNIYG